MERTPRHFEELEHQLSQRLDEMGRLVLGCFDDAITALRTRNVRLAQDVVRRDARIDLLENDVDERSLDLILLHQVVAGDLRLALAASKLSPELERMGDLACSIAMRASELAEAPSPAPPAGLFAMATKVRAMVLDALTGLMNRDVALARAVIAEEDNVDATLDSLFRTSLSSMIEDPRSIRASLRHVMIAKYLEQIGDGAVAIAEHSIYLVEGRNVRHHREA